VCFYLQDALTRYSGTYPDFVEQVRFNWVSGEAKVRSLQPGQEGQALVGFGKHKFETLQCLYKSKNRTKSGTIDCILSEL